MNKLDSTGYRIWYNIRRRLPWFRNRPIPEPIVWRKAESVADPKFIDELDDNETKKYLKIKEEIDLLSKIHNRFPNKIKDYQWRELLTHPTRKERLNYLKFIKKNEDNRVKENLKKKNKTNPTVPIQCYHEYKEIDPHPSVIAKWEQILTSSRFYQSTVLKETPKIAVDCRYLPYLTKRAQNLTSIQLAYMMNFNLSRHKQWPLYFVNFDYQQPAMKTALKKHLGGTLNPKNLCVITSESNYVDLFDKDEVIYLSPDAEEVLDVVEPDKTYVIGAIVDRVPEKNIPKHASLEISQVDQVKAKRLPLNEFVDWKSGTQFLTLVTVMKLLQESYDNGNNWEKTFDKLIPKRYVEPPEEKNKLTRELHHNYRTYDLQILKIIEEKLGKEQKIHLQ